MATLAIYFRHGCRVEGRTRNSSLLKEDRNKLCNISVGLDLFSKWELVIRIVECKTLFSLFCHRTFSVPVIIFSDIILAFSNFKISNFLLSTCFREWPLLCHSKIFGFRIRSLNPGEVPPVPIESEAGWASYRSGRFVDEKVSLYPVGNLTTNPKLSSS